MESVRTRRRDVLNPALSEIPEPPEAFGQDGGKFYQCYDELAEEIDEGMMRGLKEQLDGLIIFAGLFAGVNTTFLFFTIPMLWGDTSQDTNALILQTNAILIEIAMGRNNSFPMVADLPSASYTPSTNIITMNMLFALALTFALLSSFLAMIGRQWLVYYSKPGGGGPDQERWAQLQRFLGARRWRLELILGDVIPSLLQIGLVLFCISLVLYLQGISPIIAKAISIPMYAGLAFFAGCALCTLWDKFCPFHTPLSHFLHWGFNSLTAGITRLEETFVKFLSLLREASSPTNLRGIFRIPIRAIEAVQEIELKGLPGKSLLRGSVQAFTNGRVEDTIEYLQTFALQRAVCTSEDAATLLHAVANIPTITDTFQLEKLWEEKQFQESLLKLYRSSYNRTLQLVGRNRADLASQAKRLYGAAVTHLLFYLDHLQSALDLILPCLHATEGFKPLATCNLEEIPDDMPLVYVQTSLAHALISTLLSTPSTLDVQALCAHLNSCSDSLSDPDWKLLSLISWAIAQLPRITSLYHTDFERMCKAFRGDIDTSPDNMRRAFEVISKRRDVYTLDCDRVLTNLVTATTRVVTNECPHPGMRLDQTLVLIESVEGALRSANCSVEIRTLVRQMRSAVVAQFRRTCTHSHNLWGEITIISSETLDGLISLFRTLRGAIPTQGQSYEQEDLNIIEIFGPLVEEIISEDMVFNWENQDCGPEERPESLTQRLDAIRETFEQFKLDVYNSGAHHQQESGSESQGSPAGGNDPGSDA